MKNKRRKYAKIISGQLPAGVLVQATLLLAGVLAVMVAPRFPAQIEKYYSMGAGSIFMKMLSGFSRLFPFSLAEILIAGGILFLLFFILVRIPLAGFRKKHRRKSRKALHPQPDRLSRVFRIFRAAALAYLLFYGLWGLNYFRIPLLKIAGYPAVPYSAKTLADFTARVAWETTSARAQVMEDAADGIARLQGEPSGAAVRAAPGLQKLQEKFPEFRITGVRAKPVVLSGVLSRLGIAGFFFPFTGEASVNVRMPAITVPQAVCHELAHLNGYAREEEAEFLACMACRLHPDPDFRYSGRLVELSHCLNLLRAADPAAWQAVWNGMDDGVARDLAAVSRYWKDREGLLTRVSEKVNDYYLKSNRQEQGVGSYSQVVGLLLAEAAAEAAAENP